MEIGVSDLTANVRSPVNHIYSLAREFEPRFPVFLPGREAKTFLKALGTMVVTRSGVSSGGGCGGWIESVARMIQGRYLGAYRVASLIPRGKTSIPIPLRC